MSKDKNEEEGTYLALIVQHHQASVAQVHKVPLAGSELTTPQSETSAWWERVAESIRTGDPIHIDSEKGHVVLGLSHDVSVRIIPWSQFETEQREAQERREEQERQMRATAIQQLGRHQVVLPGQFRG